MSNQLVKKNPSEGYQNVFPKTFIDAIKDRESGVTLTEILSGFNMYFLSYNGSRALTRCKVPKSLRKEGLWITYVLYDHTVVTEWYNSEDIEDAAFSSNDNWRQASNMLVGDISISTDGYWVINGEKSEVKATGETGVTPLLRIGDSNKFQVSYNNGKTWKDISNSITNNLRISKYIGINDSLPTSGVAEGTIYMKGPYYAEDDTLNDNPIYRMWVYAWKGNTLAWQDNGEFTSISAGIVQETGNSEIEVMSQKAVTDRLTELKLKIGGGNTEVEGDKILSSEFTTDLVFSRPSGNPTTSVSMVSTKRFLPIPENIERIEAICAMDSTYYYGLSFFSENSINTFVGGIDRISEEGNIAVVINKEDIPANAKYVCASAYISNLDTCYIKIICVDNVVGITENINYLNDDIKFLQPTKLYSGLDFESKYIENMTDSEFIATSHYPTGAKSRGESIVFRADVEVFDKIVIGKTRYSTAEFGSQYTSWLEIDNTNIYLKKTVLSGISTSNILPHGLTIRNYIYIFIYGKEDGSVDISLSTFNGEYKTNIGLYGGDGGTLAWMSNNNGNVVAKSIGSILHKCKLAVSNKYLRQPLWIFGASFESTHDETSWPYYLMQLGYNNYFIDAIPGRNSADTYIALEKAIALGSPKYLIWTMWGNDTTQELDLYLNKVLQLCKSKGIELIIVNRPNSSASFMSSVYQAKKAIIDKYIAEGVRYWNIAMAVSSDEASPNGWYEGFLQNDGVHPTSKGSKAIAMQLMVDVPEIMQY